LIPFFLELPTFFKKKVGQRNFPSMGTAKMVKFLKNNMACTDLLRVKFLRRFFQKAAAA